MVLFFFFGKMGSRTLQCITGEFHYFVRVFVYENIGLYILQYYYEESSIDMYVE